MTELQGSPEFKALKEEQRRAYRIVSRELVELVQRYAIPLCFAPPLSIGGKVNGATGCILRLGSGSFLITANHVLAEFEKRRETEPLNWQFGNLPPFDPIPRVVWSDAGRDVVFLRISEEEVADACNDRSLVFSSTAGWPPPAPCSGQVVLVSGFPRILREVNEGTISAGPYSALFRVTTAAPGYFMCQIVQDELISFDDGPLPPEDADVGGLSGGPVVLMTSLAYPLVGVVTEHLQAFNILRVATLEGITEDALGRVQLNSVPA